MGGLVLYMNGWRVNGQLAVSRAIGDLEHKPFVTGEAEYEEYEMEGDEEFLILACDRLWDVVEPTDAVECVQKCEEYEMEGDEEFLILACDGLWDVVEPTDAVECVQKCEEYEMEGDEEFLILACDGLW